MGCTLEPDRVHAKEEATLTTQLRIGNLEADIELERRGNRLPHEILCGDQIRKPRTRLSSRQTHAPASRSSFSRPLILEARTTSPVPMAPCLPLRRTRAFHRGDLMS